MRRFLAGPSDDEVDAELKRTIRRGTPYGDPEWQAKTAKAGHMEATLREPGGQRRFLGEDDCATK